MKSSVFLITTQAVIRGDLAITTTQLEPVLVLSISTHLISYPP